MINVDDEMRGAIEQDIKIQLESDLLEDFGWTFDTIPISSKEDYLLGCAVGKLMMLAWRTFREKKYDATNYDLEQVRDIIRLRLPEIKHKIVAELNK